MTALMHASMECSLECMKELIIAGAELSQGDEVYCDNGTYNYVVYVIYSLYIL